MYVSRIQIATNNLSQIAYALGGDSYRAHKVCWKFFEASDDRRFLYRQQQRGFLTLSEGVPKDDDGAWSIESKPYDPKLKAGNRLKFMVTANATVCREGKRHDVMMDAKQRGEDREAAALKWLSARADGWGFQLTYAQIGAYQQHELRKRGARIQYSTVDYSGILAVTNPDKFRETLFNGIGRAKGFGCGLMLVRRLS